MAKDKSKKKAKAAEAEPKKEQFLSLEDKEATETKKARTPYSERRAIIYVSHLPHGFYEKQLREYLGQFGAITNLRLGRSRRTGNSKGYAFVEFKYPEVAKIVCDTMNNYLMFEKLVKCEMVPPERMSKDCFKGKVDPSNPPGQEARREAKKQVNALRTEEQNNRRLKKQLRKLEALKGKLEQAGVNVDLQFEKAGGGSSKKAKKAAPKSPVMEVDMDETEVKLKTPANVRKVKSRDSSAAATPKGKAASAVTPKMKKAAADLMPKDLVMQQVADKLKKQQQKGGTPKGGTPKGTPKRLQEQKKPMSAMKAGSAANTPKAGKKKRKSM